ncbi:LTA synthase family protein [Jeotgalibaca caeni]|uniref:LTA synthase family protein n=1 Tax=Jeotgalibaca caeni TaxID=3028623 RepID=UPI00237E3131|nr:LTA synthase family protein [Jeotgalibaca caeni]MDE1548166.1 LTA synthase family protein [Jeotgalibaca caeni]
MSTFLTFGIGLLVSLLVVFLLQWFHFQYDFEATLHFFDYKTRLNILQAGVVFILFLWFFFLTASTGLSSFLLLFISLLIGIGTQQKMLYRGEPLYPSDVYFLKDFGFLLEMVEIGIVIGTLVILALLVGSLILFFKKRKKRSVGRTEKVIRLSGFIITSGLLFYAYQFNQPGNLIRAAFNERTNWISYSQEKNYTENGVVTGLMYNLKSPAVNRPKEYSKEKIEEIYKKYAQEAASVNEIRTNALEEYNIIFVMSETFSDPTRIEGMEISKDPMPLYREWAERYRSGLSFSQGYGGGTANIEFEALTGISLEPLASNITTPFIQLSNQMKSFPKVTDLMAEAGHHLTAIHPYNTTMYKRLENYQSLGFDEFLFQDDMTYTKRIDENTFISDESTYQEVMDVMKQSDGKDFVHLVTMQNHKPFVHKYENVDFEVQGAPYNLEVAHYAQGIQYSDIALDNFLKELDTTEEKTMVVFWGDHLPSFYGEELFDLNGHVRMHETPLLFYTNFSEDSQSIGTISPIYFMNHVLELTNAPITPFIAMLERMEQILPAFEKGIYLERETELHYSRADLRPSTQLVMNEYDLILYDITTGKNYSKDLGFY